MEVDFSFCCLQSPDSKDTRGGERMSGEESKIFTFYVYKCPALSLMVHTILSVIDGVAREQKSLKKIDEISGIYSPSYDKFMA